MFLQLKQSDKFLTACIRISHFVTPCINFTHFYIQKFSNIHFFKSDYHKYLYFFGIEFAQIIKLINKVSC